LAVGYGGGRQNGARCESRKSGSSCDARIFFDCFLRAIETAALKFCGEHQQNFHLSSGAQ
jgi:hypothetical protein